MLIIYIFELNLRGNLKVHILKLKNNKESLGSLTKGLLYYLQGFAKLIYPKDDNGEPNFQQMQIPIYVQEFPPKKSKDNLPSPTLFRFISNIYPGSPRTVVKLSG